MSPQSHRSTSLAGTRPQSVSLPSEHVRGGFAEQRGRQDARAPPGPIGEAASGDWRAAGSRSHLGQLAEHFSVSRAAIQRAEKKLETLKD